MKGDHQSATIPEETANEVAGIAKSQPLLTLSGIGLAIGSLKTALRRFKREISPIRYLKFPTIPKYLKRNYIKYPALILVCLFAARRVRSAVTY